jgi:hypothetical protein
MLAIDAEAPGPGDEEDEDEEAAEDGHVLHEELWWPDSPNKPDLCLLRIEPFTAEFWDGPASAAVAAFEFAKTRFAGEERCSAGTAR